MMFVESTHAIEVADAKRRDDPPEKITIAVNPDSHSGSSARLFIFEYSAMTCHTRRTGREMSECRLTYFRTSPSYDFQRNSNPRQTPLTQGMNIADKDIREECYDAISSGGCCHIGYRRHDDTRPPHRQMRPSSENATVTTIAASYSLQEVEHNMHVRTAKYSG